MPEKKSERPEGQMRRRPMRRRKKVCAFCADANKALDYKDVALLKKYVSERGKNPSKKNHRKLCKASESSYSSC